MKKLVHICAGTRRPDGSVRSCGRWKFPGEDEWHEADEFWRDKLRRAGYEVVPSHGICRECAELAVAEMGGGGGTDD